MAKSKEKADKLAELRERCKLAMDADYDNRSIAMDDMKFTHIPGHQWTERMRQERGERPCYEFNKLRVTIKRVVNDMRANRPQGKVRPVEEGDKDTAEVLEGLIRNIWNVSDGDTVIDAAAEYQVTAGMGAWRISVDYADDQSFDQEIKVEEIRNPFNLYADPACQDALKRDARYWFRVSRIAKSAFEARWPKAEKSDFESDSQFDDDEDWEDEESVRIVEYWYKEPVQRVIGQLDNGQAVDMADQEALGLATASGAMVIRKRAVNTWKIRMCIASGSAILEEAEWAGQHFPFIMVYGESMVIDGKQRWFGLPRFAKDAQVAYNYSRTLASETVALAPQAKWWATPAQAKGHTDKWAEAHKKNYPFLLTNVDPQMPGYPQRMGGADVPVALIQEAQLASEDIKSVTGIFDPSLGKESNETSGKAIMARQRQGEIAVFNYMDNLSKGIRRTWEILIDLIPKIYDTPREVRSLGVDGAVKYARINQVDPMTGQKILDLNTGKYDVAVTVGPSFATQRLEGLEMVSQIVQNNPAVAPLIQDLQFKLMDNPYADKMAERARLMLPPQVQAMEQQGKELPPEAMQAMQQAEQAMQMVQQQAALIQQAGAEMQTEKAQVDKAKADLQVAAAKMQADYQKIVADLTKRETELLLKQAQAGSDANGQAVAQDREALSAQVTAALAEIQARAAQFMTQAAAVIAEHQARTQPQVVVANPPKRKQVRVKRVNGELIGEIQEI
jgi:hypothetical protein